MDEIIYTKYSNERDRRFCIRTDIMENKERRIVRKHALYPEGASHIKNIFRWFKELDGNYKKNGLTCNKCRMDGDDVYLEYISGKTLEEVLDGLLEKGEHGKASEMLEEYLRKVEKICSGQEFYMTNAFSAVFGEEEFGEELACGDATNIDMLCSNVVLTDIPCVLDYEWTFDFPIPGKFVLYRIIHYYVDTHSVRSCLAEMDFYGKMGISPALKEQFVRMEARFQEYITGTHVPMREMFSSITPGTGAIQMAGMGALQVFFSNGDGYSEEKSRSFPIEEGKVSCSFEIPQGCIRIRVDPGNLPCGVMVSKMEIDGEPVDLKKAIIEQGSICGNWLYIAKEDPNITEIPVPPHAKKMEIILGVYGASPELLENVKAQVRENMGLRDKIARLELQIRDMKNTKVWKLYQSYRNRVERKK